MSADRCLTTADRYSAAAAWVASMTIAGSPAARSPRAIQAELMPASRPTRSTSGPAVLIIAAIASGVLAMDCSRTTRPAASMTHTAVRPTGTSRLTQTMIVP